MRSEKHIHIVSFNVPYPADYGGVIDVFYKIKALAKEGVRVHLHTFQYGRAEADILKKLCYRVHYYKRQIYKDPFFQKQPYIVATRNSPELLANLVKDDHPILFEGVHCCYFLDHPALAHRVRIVRMHNIEHLYYKSLARVERNVLKKYFFSLEAERLRKFEQQVLHKASYIAAISPADTQQLRLKYNNVFYLPVFHPNEEVNMPKGKDENFALYHGNLGVGENNEAALYLVKEVFSQLDYPLVIAGMNPSKELKRAVEGLSNIRLEYKINTEQIYQLIRKAHINVLPTFQSTGIKLKLINVLFQGRHCVVNPKMVHNTGLEPLCHIAHTPTEMRNAVQELIHTPFGEDEAEARENYLEENFDNAASAHILMDKAFSIKLMEPLPLDLDNP